MNYIKRKLKTTSGLMSITMIMLTLVLGVSYSTFIITTEKYKASEMLVSTLTYGISITRETGTSGSSISGRTVTLTTTGYSIYNITITSLNEINSNYSLEYKIKSGSGRVVYLGTSSYNPTGSINKNGTSVYTKVIKVGVERTSSNNMQVEFNVSGGYTYNSTPTTLTGYSKVSTKGHKVVVSSNNTTYGTITNGSQIINNNGTATITINPKSGYEYSSNTCGGTVSGNTLTINSITAAKTCTVTFKASNPFTNGTLANKIYTDNSNRLERTSFDDVLANETATDNTIYKASGNYTEDGSDVYYFAGNVSNNWVKFGKDENNNDLYWRIIRTNEDGGVRLLYAGTKHNTNKAYIDDSSYKYSTSSSNPLSVGYMYGTTGNLENNRLNTNSSKVKTQLDAWYERGLNVKTDTSGNKYDAYVSKTAIYCNDRSGEYYKGDNTGNMHFATFNRLYNSFSEQNPTYRCGYNSRGGSFDNVNSWNLFTSDNWHSSAIGMYKDASIQDKFTVSTTTGNGNLKYPLGLMTADEVVMAGGKYGSKNSYAYYYSNSYGASATASNLWWTMSPSYYNNASRLFSVNGQYNPGYLYIDTIVTANGYVRPVISLKACVQYKSGNGKIISTASTIIVNTPYEVSIDTTCASKEN